MRKKTRVSELEAMRRVEQDRIAGNRRKIHNDWQRALDNRYRNKEIRQVIERVWAAAFFDGEGNVDAGAKGGLFNCAIEQVDVINLERFQAAVTGVGKITWVSPSSKPKEQPRRRWKVTNQKDLKAVWNSIGEFLTPAKQSGFARALSVPTYTILRQNVLHGKDKPLPDGTLSVEVPDRQSRGRP
jgi:hypothetical protein